MKPTLDWQIASITNIKPETTKVKSFTLTLPSWMRHRAGQHYDLRLTAEDGYQTQRSYSIASEPEREGEIDITVERIGGSSYRAVQTSADRSAATSSGKRGCCPGRCC